MFIDIKYFLSKFLISFWTRLSKSLNVTLMRGRGSIILNVHFIYLIQDSNDNVGYIILIMS